MAVTNRTVYTSSVSQKGQITLPVEFRRELDIEPKDIVVLAIEDGKILIESAKSRLHSIYQTVPALDPPRGWKEIEQAAFDEFAARNARTGLPSEGDE